MYSVPANEDGKELLPDGLWGAIQVLSIGNEQDWLESREKTYVPISSTQESATETFRILENQDHDESLVLEGVLPNLDGGPFEVSFLPNSFKMDLANQWESAGDPNKRACLESQ